MLSDQGHTVVLTGAVGELHRKGGAGKGELNLHRAVITAFGKTVGDVGTGGRILPDGLAVPVHEQLAAFGEGVCQFVLGLADVFMGAEGFQVLVPHRGDDAVLGVDQVAKLLDSPHSKYGRCGRCFPCIFAE